MDRTALLSPLYDRLKEWLAGGSYPVVYEYGETGPSRACPGASILTSGRAVSEILDRAGVAPGDRVVAQLANGVDFIAVLAACARLGATFCPCAPNRALDPAAYEPRLIVGGPHGVPMDDLYEARPPELLAPLRPPDPSLAVVFATSGTTGHEKLVGLTTANVLGQVESHAPLLALRPQGSVCSYLSWGHAFGGVLELLCSLEAGLEIHLPCPDRFDLRRWIDLGRTLPHPHVFTVPAVAEAALATDRGGEWFGRLEGGIVGGSAIGPELAAALTRDAPRLRVGYGQTECSPGVTLGEPGVFRPGGLGRPVGCEVRLSGEGELLVRGPNLSPDAVASATDGWHATGDLARQELDGSYTYLGRRDSTWKLPNGRLFFPEGLEQSLSSPGRAVLLVEGNGGRVRPIVVTDRAFDLDLPSELPFEDPVTVSPTVAAREFRTNGKWCRRKVREWAAEKGPLEVGPATRLTPSLLAAWARDPDRAASLPTATRRLLRRGHEFAVARAASGEAVYGWTTGFGPLVGFGARCSPEDQGRGLVAHLQAGQGPPLAPLVVRGMLLLRLHTLSQGLSGVSEDCAESLARLLSAGVVPVVPTYGSVGASGDLIPMAHAVAALTGDGYVWDGDRNVHARQALEARGVSPLVLQGRDSLALVNGTALMGATAALALEAYSRQLAATAALTGLLYDLLGAHGQPLRPVLHRSSGHPAHETVAALIGQAAEGRVLNADRPLQEPYSLRCTPQLLGAALRTLRHAWSVVTDELNGVSDNPLFDVEAEEVVHGGNFFGQETAFAMDSLSTAVVQSANLAERQLALLCDPARTDGLPPLLSPRPGLDSGLAGIQLAATAVLAEMRRECVPASVQSIPTNGSNQDVVPMGTHAAQAALRQTERFTWLLGSLAFALRQAFHLVGREPRCLGGTALWPLLCSVPALTEDRPLACDVRLLGQGLLELGYVTAMAGQLGLEGWQGPAT